ncbi:MAG: WG repeat-containing protein [Alistipes onderdonkii]
MFTLRQYLTTLADTHGLTKTLGGMEVCRDSRGRMCYTVGNSAIVFRVRHEGHIRSLRCYMHPPRHLAEIYGERLLPQELYLYDSPRSGVWVDVVLGDWIEGATLHEAVAEAAAAEDATRLGQLAAAFDRLAARLTSDDWAHGDLKPGKYRRGFLGAAAPDRPRCHVPARIRRGGEPRTGYRGLPTPGTDDPRLQCLARRLPRGADLDGPSCAGARPHLVRTLPRCRRAALLPAADPHRRGAPRGHRAFRTRRGWPCSTASHGCCMHPRPVCSGCRSCWRWAARTGGPPCGGREGEETTGNTGGDKSGDTDGGAERYPAGNTGCGADKHTGGGTRGITGNTGYGRDKHTDGDTSGGELFAGKDGDVRNDGGAVSPELFVGNGLWGYRTPERIVIPPLYDCGFDFTEGLAAVRVGQAWHYIDIEGRTRIRCAGYEAVKPFRNGRAEVIRDGRRLEIDRAGREFEI